MAYIGNIIQCENNFQKTGIGLGLVKEFLKADKVTKIIATCRNKEKAEELVDLESNSRVKVLELDVSKYENDYKDFIAQVSDELGSDGLNLLINSAGIMGETQSLGDLTSEAMIETYKVNLAKPDAGFGCDNAAIIQMSTSGASIAENGLGECLFGTKRKMEFLFLSLHPGWVKTDLGGSNAQITVEECVSTMVKTICQLSDKDHGTFLRYNNTPVAW
ncbi:unnamed protein product [Lepeophtheirus salmonis]|uniref:(salmon louse) hypothetical protein n=1 Tax=Lepeophtheirus salmonis TaxID=72036 RepID=A0A7R8D3W2_LEPSM|nr:unnamed protein product [Lepeophtheirus salmonis]CAF2968878.1 unnamed protein product [Lepeophtheirus salmonis]